MRFTMFWNSCISHHGISCLQITRFLLDISGCTTAAKIGGPIAFRTGHKNPSRENVEPRNRFSERDELRVEGKFVNPFGMGCKPFDARLELFTNPFKRFLKSQNQDLRYQIQDKTLKTKQLVNQADIDVLSHDELKRRFDILFTPCKF